MNRLPGQVLPAGLPAGDVTSLADALRDGAKGTAAKREGACVVIETVAKEARAAAEHQTTALVGDLLRCCADKHSKETQTAACAAMEALARTMSAHGLRTVLPALLDAMDPKEKWQTMVAALFWRFSRSARRRPRRRRSTTSSPS